MGLHSHSRAAHAAFTLFVADVGDHGFGGEHKAGLRIENSLLPDRGAVDVLDVADAAEVRLAVCAGAEDLPRQEKGAE